MRKISDSSRRDFPVFYDPSMRRGKFFWTSVAAGITLLGIIALVMGLAIRTLATFPIPTLQETVIQTEKSIQSRINRTREVSMRKAQTDLTSYLRLRHSKRISSSGTVIGFYVPWDDNSYVSLQQNISHLTIVSPEWMNIKDASGNVIFPTSQEIAKINTVVVQNPATNVYPLVNNYDENTQKWNSARLSEILKSANKRQYLIGQLQNFVTTNHYAGIVIDFEDISAAQHKDLHVFMSEITTSFHAAGLHVLQAVPVADDSYNYAQYAQESDGLIAMAYDEHWSTSNPGPIASQSWFTEQVLQLSKKVPANRLIVGLAAYGYDWGKVGVEASETTFTQTMQQAQQGNLHLIYDSSALNPYYAYQDQSHVTHTVWFTDAAVTCNELTVVKNIQAAGVAIWRLGAEDPGIWQTLPMSTGATTSTIVSKIQAIPTTYDLQYIGTGEVLKVASLPTQGERTLVVDKSTGLISHETYTVLPSSYVINRWGASNAKQIALTFDDGPDTTYTPQILAILNQYHIQATFFIIGENADMNKSLLAAEYTAGNDIGVHTFTHPNISKISDEQLNLEVNATQRLIESVTGHSTILFRPPYGEDVEPATPSEVRPLLVTSQLGYYTVGMGVDPSDWATPGVQAIVASTLQQVSQQTGHIILLHDGGGDRSQTVAALKILIPQLQSQGYTFVTVTQLLGLSRNQVMPTLSTQDHVSSAAITVGWWTSSAIMFFLYVVFSISLWAGLLRVVLLVILALIEKRRDTKETVVKDTYNPKVSVIVPAWGEEKVIVKTVQSLLTSRYKNFTIVVVDDGSPDNTFQVATEAFKNNPRVTVLKKENGGKASALNYGIAHTDAEIIIVQDADTLFDKNTISELVKHFRNPRVGAVAGNVKVGNRINLLTKFQAAEYITSQNLERRAFNLLNGITVVPGAVGAWRRELVLECGAFTHDTLAEDAELTLRILRMGYVITYEEKAIAYTEAPDTQTDLLRQRFRWMYGTFQTFWKHHDTLLNPTYGTLGLIAMPNLFVFQIVLLLLSPLADIVVFLSVGIGLMQFVQHPEVIPSGLVQIGLYYVLFLMVDFIIALIAFSFEKNEDKHLIWLLPLQRLYYRFILFALIFKVIKTIARGPLVGWGKLDRKATVAPGLAK